MDNETFATSMIELLRDAGYTVTPPEAEPKPEPATYSAEEAWGKMEEGWRVDVSLSTTGDDCKSRCWYLGGDGAVWYESAAGDRHSDMERPWLVAMQEYSFTLHGIHPDAHKHALQRHLAAGLTVGSRVEVVREAEDCEGGWPEYWTRSMSLGVQTVTATSDHAGGCIELDGGFDYPAHCLRLIEAEPKPTFKEGDRVPIPLTVRNAEPDHAGEIRLSYVSPKSGDWGIWCDPSALRRDEGGGG